MEVQMSTVETRRLGVLSQIAALEIPAAWAKAFGILSFTALLSLGAHVKFFLPGNPVPVTLQTMFVLLAGALLGPWAGLSAVALYLVIGMCGVPFFAMSGVSGLMYFTGPTGGYLAGFLLAAVTTGLAFQRTERTAVRLAVLAAASLLILLCGALWLGVLMHLPVSRAWMLGVAPFLYGDVLKTATAMTVCAVLRRR